MKNTLLFFCCLLITSTALAQDTIVNDAPHAEAEFNVAINPLDSNNMVIATIQGFVQPDAHFISIYYTNDFGESWQASDFHGEYPGYDGAGDPVLSFDDQGNVFLVNLSVGNGYDVATILSKSEDGGATWSLASVLTDFSDKPWMAIDVFADSPAYGNIYIPLVAEEPELYVLDTSFQTIHQMEIPNGDHLPSVALKKNGDIFVSTVGINDPNEVFIQQYTDGGATLVHSTPIVSFPDFTFNAPDVSERFQPTVYIAIDNSEGPYSGRIYMGYTASEMGDSTYFDVFLTYSDDDGSTWSVPNVVHSDQTAEEQQFYSSLYVNTQGVLIMDWYDRRNFDNSNNITDFYMGISYDGGETFTEIQLNSESMDFNFIIPVNEEFGIGEYHQLVATENTAVSFWADGRTNDGDINIYMAKVNIDNPLTGVNELSVLSDKIKISNLYPQPVGSVFNVDLSVKESYTLKCEIIDIEGRSLWTIDWIDYSVGDHQLSIPCNLSAGTYIFQVKSDKGYFKTMKFIKT